VDPRVVEKFESGEVAEDGGEEAVLELLADK
jgi:hypothetical protein